MQITDSSSIYYWRSVIAVISVEKLALFARDVGFPLPYSQMSAVQAVFRDFLRHILTLEDPDLEDRGKPSAIALALAAQTDAALRRAVGEQGALRLWLWAARRLATSPVNKAVSSFADVLNTVVNRPHDMQAAPSPLDLADLHVAHTVYRLHNDGISEAVDMLSQQPLSALDQLAQDVYAPHAYRSAACPPASPYEGLMVLIGYQLELELIVRLKHALSPEAHATLHELIATADPRHSLAVAEVAAALAEVEG